LHHNGHAAVAVGQKDDTAGLFAHTRDTAYKAQTVHRGPAIKDAIARGTKIVIFTARAAEKENIPPIKKWLKDNDLPDLEISNEKTLVWILTHLIILLAPL
jgi:hypothetical protein